MNNNNKFPGFKFSDDGVNIRHTTGPGRYDNNVIYSGSQGGGRSASGGQKPPANRKKKGKSIAAIITCITVIVVAVLSVGGVYLWSRTNIKPDSTAIDWKNREYVKNDADVINVLICGIDIDKENPGRDNNNLTDTMMIASLNTKTRQVSVLSIPRDTYVGNETYSGKINEIYKSKNASSSYHGLTGLSDYILANFFISIDHYLTIDMVGFRSVVDSIGGVECDVPHTFTLDGMTIKEGFQKLDGKQAERFVRERHSFINGDFGRMESQQAFLKAFAKKVLGLGTKDLGMLVVKAHPYLSSDMGSINELKEFSKKLKGVDVETMTFNTIPVNGAMVGGLSVQKIDREAFAELINQYFPRKDAAGNVTIVDAEMLDVS